jgi:hypothetical protein
VITGQVSPLLQRTLAAVYRFYDVFLFPIDDTTPPIASPLSVSIPALGLNAFRAETDLTYRFSAVTTTRPAPTGGSLAVQVSAPVGDYADFDPIPLTVSLPLPLSSPVQASDFLIVRRLWPTVRFRPPQGETAVRGQISSATAQPVNGLTVEMWPGPAVTPPAGTPFTVTNSAGEFLFRFPLLKGRAGSSASFNIRLNSGAIAVSPASLPLVLGSTQVIAFQRT